MSGRPEIVYPEYRPFDPNSLWYKTLQIAHKYSTARVECLNATYQIADRGELTDVADSADMAYHVNSHLLEAIERGQLVVVDDNTNARVIGFAFLGNNKVQMISINRFGKDGDTTMQILLNPHLEAGFEDGGFTLTVYGTVKNGNGFNGVVREITKISPNGDNNPPSFFIATANEVLFGKIDATQSLSCSYAHRGWQWAVLVRERNNTPLGRRYK